MSAWQASDDIRTQASVSPKMYFYGKMCATPSTSLACTLVDVVSHHNWGQGQKFMYMVNHYTKWVSTDTDDGFKDYPTSGQSVNINGGSRAIMIGGNINFGLPSFGLE